AIERYIEKQGYDLPTDFYFLDKAVSGARLDRPSLDRLRHLASDGTFSVVVCYSPDRLARNYAHQWVVLDELQRNGVRVEFVNQPDLGDNPQAQLLLGVQGLFAEYERAMIKERLRLGRLYKMQTGQLMHNAPPYGYRYIPVSDKGGGQWVIDEREAEAVRQIFAWYTGEEQLTIWQITERLNNSYIQSLRRAKTWQYSVVHKILKRTAYIGRTHFNRERILPETVGTPRTTGRGPRRIAQFETRPEEEWIEVAVPPLIEVAVWERAQERLKTNQKFAQRNNKRHLYLLRGLLECATCGYTLQGRTQNGRVYYHCEHGGKDRYPTVQQHRAHIAGRIIEPLVWDAVAELLNDPRRIADVWEAEASQYETTPDELGRLQARQRKLEQQWVRLLDAFQDDLLDKAQLGQRKQLLDQERQALGARIEHIQRQQVQQSAKAQIIDDFAAFCAQAQIALQNSTPEVKQEVLRLLVQSILFEEEAITIKHIIPTDDKCRLLPRGNPLEKVYSRV
ncbi:MAG: recombinase family protein, partial [Gammaproteobacteria bacterium]|nr:recombinase family protein [Gammaproteobacteria bacterium]